MQEEGAKVYKTRTCSCKKMQEGSLKYAGAKVCRRGVESMQRQNYAGGGVESMQEQKYAGWKLKVCRSRSMQEGRCDGEEESLAKLSTSQSRSN